MKLPSHAITGFNRASPPGSAGVSPANSCWQSRRRDAGAWRLDILPAPSGFLCRKLCRKLCRIVGQHRDPMFTQHRLKVYQKALALGAGAQECSASWGRRHAIVEHFRRASESIVLNIAEGARLVSEADKARTLDYALGSTLECAACLDTQGRELLSRIVAMLSRF